MFRTQDLYKADFISAHSQPAHYFCDNIEVNLNGGMLLLEEQTALRDSEYLDFIASLELENLN